MGRIVIYNHPGSADGKHKPMQSPAIIQRVIPQSDTDSSEVCDMWIFGPVGFYLGKEITRGDGPSQWNWQPRV